MAAWPTRKTPRLAGDHAATAGRRATGLAVRPDDRRSGATPRCDPAATSALRRELPLREGQNGGF